MGVRSGLGRHRDSDARDRLVGPVRAGGALVTRSRRPAAYAATTPITFSELGLTWHTSSRTYHHARPADVMHASWSRLEALHIRRRERDDLVAGLLIAVATAIILYTCLILLYL